MFGEYRASISQYNSYDVNKKINMLNIHFFYFTSRLLDDLCLGDVYWDWYNSRSLLQKCLGK